MYRSSKNTSLMHIRLAHFEHMQGVCAKFKQLRM
jgi:hypothetical protein